MCLNPPLEKMDRRKATLILEDGTQFSGFSFGAETSIGGEIGELSFVYVMFHLPKDDLLIMIISQKHNISFVIDDTI